MVKKQHDDAKSRIEEAMTLKRQQVEAEKNRAILKEAKRIKKKEQKSKKLEMMESSILDRLKDTHNKQ